MDKIEVSIGENDVEKIFYPKVKDQVFHFTSAAKLAEIEKSGCIFPSSKEGLKTTSIYSSESAGKHLEAVCLFDLRNKTEKQVGPGRSYYNFLPSSAKGKKLVYLLVSREYYKDITTLEGIDSFVKNETMYLPEIESWHKGELPLKKIGQILILDIIAEKSMEAGM